MMRLRTAGTRAARAARRARRLDTRAAGAGARHVRHHQTHLAGPGAFGEEPFEGRGGWDGRSFTVGIGGPVGSGKTALTLELCRKLRGRASIGVVTNDIFTQEDAEFLVRRDALPQERIRAVETGGCPHAAIREDISSNLQALEELTQTISGLEAGGGGGAAGGLPRLLICESGGDNLAANFSRELADYTIYVIDVAGGDKVPRKGGPGITQSDLLVVNKIDLAEAVGADLDVMDRDARLMRGDPEDGGGPTEFLSVRHQPHTVDAVVNEILHAMDHAYGRAHDHPRHNHHHRPDIVKPTTDKKKPLGLGRRESRPYITK